MAKINNQYDFFKNSTIDANGNLVTINDATQQQELIDALGVINGVPYFIAVNEGLQEGVAPFSKFGRNSDVDTGSAPEDIWHGGGDYTGFPDVSETLEIYSTSANDTAGGTGARTVTISNLLDDDFNQMPDVTVTLNGTTPVSLGVQTYRRSSRVFVETAGTAGENQGDIILRHTTTTTNIFAVMPSGLNQTQILAYTVPAGKTLYIPHFSIKMSRANGSDGSSNITVRVKDGESNVWRALRNEEITNSQSYNFIGLAYFVGYEKQDIKARIESVSDNNTIVTGEADGFLVDN